VRGVTSPPYTKDRWFATLSTKGESSMVKPQNYLIQMDTLTDMDVLHNRWGIQYKDLNHIHDLRVEEARLANQPTPTLHSTLWYYVYNVYMTELFIMYTNWTPQIDGLIRYCLPHGIKVRVYDALTLYDVTIRPICNIGKVRHIKRPAGSTALR
jgi:hypothetical protein